MGEVNAMANELVRAEKRIAALEASLRDCLHLLETAENLTVTDRPAWSMDRLVVAKSQTWVQTFRETEAVKRARELVET